MTTVDKNKARRFVFDPDDMTAILESVVRKHGTHNQKTHGRKGGGGGSAFFESGGEVTGALTPDAEELRTMRASLDAMEDTLGEEFVNDRGVKFTRTAISTEGEPDGTKVRVAYTEDGVAGAIQYFEMDEATTAATYGTFSEDPSLWPEPHIYIAYLGSTGLADRTGSALAETVLREAATKGLGVRIESADDNASAFWERIGLKRESEGSEFGFTHGLSAAEVKELVDKL